MEPVTYRSKMRADQVEVGDIMHVQIGDGVEYTVATVSEGRGRVINITGTNGETTVAVPTSMCDVTRTEQVMTDAEFDRSHADAEHRASVAGDE